MNAVEYHVRASLVWWRWSAPLALLGVLKMIHVITNGGDSTPGEVAAEIIGAAIFPLAGIFLFLQRERLFPPISLSGTALTVTNHQVVFTIEWDDIDRERSVVRWKTWRLYRRSKPHFTPVLIKTAWYEAGLAQTLATRLSAT